MTTTLKRKVPEVGEVEFSGSPTFDRSGKCICEFAEYEMTDYTVGEITKIETWLSENEKQLCADIAKKYEQNYEPNQNYLEQ